MFIGTALIANGEFSEASAEKVRKCDRIIAVDGGLNHCHKWGLSPQLIIGDMDSADEAALAAFEGVLRKPFPKDKDKTDLQLAVEYAFADGESRLVIFGGLGRRIDHSLSNIILLTLFPGKLYIETESELLFVIGSKVTLCCDRGQTVSLIPLNGPVHGITTQGLKWELQDGSLDKHFVGISNVALHDKVVISVEQGDLLCVINS